MSFATTDYDNDNVSIQLLIMMTRIMIYDATTSRNIMMILVLMIILIINDNNDDNNMWYWWIYIIKGIWWS